MTEDVTPPSANSEQFNPGVTPEDLALGFRTTSEIYRTTQRILNDESLPIHKKFQALQKLNFSLMLGMLQLAFTPYPNAERSLVIARMKMMIDSQAKLLEMEANSKGESNIDPTSPKFHLITSWYIEAVRLSTLDAGIPADMRNIFFKALADRLRNFEQRIATSLTGTAAKALSEIQNPFTEKFMHDLQITHQPHTTPQ